jgi:hypothetical protein
MHQESLLNIPLVRHLLADERVAMSPRRVDARWRYEGLIPVSVAGFNHFVGQVFYGAQSSIARWLGDPAASARDLNENDTLVNEVLFSVHDYLHIWSLFIINQLAPDLRLGVAPITRANVDDFVFCHLLTEATATVGLDYWYLSTIDLNQVVPIGTSVQGLATSYHERFAEEYRRFCPSLVVQTEGFFSQIARFYCDGTFRGFGVGDIKRSPLLLKWLRHEIAYGAKQRRYIREWLSYLSGGAVTFSKEELERPVDVSAAWRQRLIGDLGARLWSKVKHDELSSEGLPIERSRVWRAQAEKPDFRFANANCVDAARLTGIGSWENGRRQFEFYFYQYVSSFSFSDFDPSLRGALASIRESRNPAFVESVFRGQKALAPLPEWPDLLFLN